MGPILTGLVTQVGGGLLGSLMGGQQKSKALDINNIRDFQAPSQNLIDEQVGVGRGLMDPQSQINAQLKSMMVQNMMNAGAQAGQQASKLGAQMGVSPGQVLMQQRQAQNQATGSVNNQWLQQLQSRMGQGIGILGNMTQQQQGLDENLANAYVQNTNQYNQQQASQAGMMGEGMAGGMDMFSKLMEGGNMGELGSGFGGFFKNLFGGGGTDK